MPATAARTHSTDLLLCGHHYRASRPTLAAAHARLIVWCRDCRHQVEPEPAEMAERYGTDLSVPDWRN